MEYALSIQHTNRCNIASADCRFQTVHVSHNDNKLIELLQLGEDAWFLSSIISTPFSCKVLIHKSKPCLRQVLKATVLILVNMWNCFILSVCNCEPYLRSRKKMLMEKNFSIALQGYWGIKPSLMLVSNILSQILTILSLKNLMLGFGVFFLFLPSPLSAGRWSFALWSLSSMEMCRWLHFQMDSEESSHPLRNKSHGFISLQFSQTCNPSGLENCSLKQKRIRMLG